MGQDLHTANKGTDTTDGRIHLGDCECSGMPMYGFVGESPWKLGGYGYVWEGSESNVQTNLLPTLVEGFLRLQWASKSWAGLL